MELFSPEIIIILVTIAAMAGFVDAIAGGGGLITIPALLWAGLPPVQALGTNKAQAVFGSFTASLHFIRRGQVNLKQLAVAVALTFVGSAIGTLTVQHIEASILEHIIPILLISFAFYFLFSKRPHDEDARQRIEHLTFAWSIGFGVGFYDGFFGPGTGSFFATAFVLLLGYNLKKATAGAKVLNFTSNFAALIFFALRGDVAWAIGLSMGLAQVGGAWMGSHLVIKHGAQLVKPILVTVSILISLKLLLD